MRQRARMLLLGTTVCGLAVVTLVENTCEPSTPKADARCHTLNGEGPVTATCVADYTG